MSRVRVIKVTPACRKLSTGDNIALVSRVFEEDEDVSQFDCDQTVKPLLYRLALYNPTFLLKLRKLPLHFFFLKMHASQDEHAKAAGFGLNFHSCCYFHTFVFPDYLSSEVKRGVHKYCQGWSVLTIFIK